MAMAMPGTAMNALQGMENGTFAALVLAALFVASNPATLLRTSLCFGLVGIACAVRPEGILVLVVMLLLRIRTIRWDGLIAAGALACTLLPCMAWYAYRTGGVIPSSSISRIMAARREVTSLGIGPFWIYGASLLRLTVYAPLVAGAWLARGRSRETAMVIVAAVTLYTFGVGCAQASRYMIGIFALLCTLASVGATRYPAYVPLALAWVVLVAAGEAVARLTQRFGAGDGYTTADLIQAAADRKAHTDALIASLRSGGCDADNPAVGAYEVQERFWLDGRIRVLSMDGVTGSAAGKPAEYGSDGCPVLENLLADKDVIGLLDDPTQGFGRCAAHGTVKAIGAAWRRGGALGWVWRDGIMIRACAHRE